MPFVPSPNTAQVEMRFDFDNQDVENVFHVRFFAPPTASDLQDLADIFSVWYTTDLRVQQPQEVSLREIYVKDITNQFGLEVTQDAPVPNGGTVTSPALPSNVTIAVSLRTGFSGRSNRGRIYHVGLWESAVTGNVIDAATKNAIQAAYDSLRASIPASLGAELVVCSKYSGVDANGRPIPRLQAVCAEVTNVIIRDDIVDSMRRRLPKRGT